jgi:hypothetical protein
MIGGVDILVEYIIRVAIRVAGLLWSGNWLNLEARMVEASCIKAGFGCTVARVNYEYIVDDQQYKGTYEKPFFFLTSGEIYVEDLAKVTQFQVRVKPDAPSESIAVAAVRP